MILLFCVSFLFGKCFIFSPSEPLVGQNSHAQWCLYLGSIVILFANMPCILQLYYTFYWTTCKSQSSHH